MLATIHNFWSKIKNQADIWFFFGFLLTFTLSIRKVLFFYPIQGSFNEYTGIYIYASDILFLLTISSFILSILCNNKSNMSIDKKALAKSLHSISTLIPAFLIALSFISIFWSQNQIIASYRSIRLLEAYLLYLYILTRFIPQSIVPRGTIQETTTQKNSTNYLQNCSTWNNWLLIIIGLGLFQSIIAIWQFIIQRSIGLSWLKESIISQNTPGVAKIILDGHKYIRAYGLFSHPNILGGFLLFSIIITLLYKNQQLFHVEQFEQTKELDTNVPRGTFVSYVSNKYTRFIIEKLRFKLTWFIYGLISIQLIGLLLTFSKSAIIGLLIAIAYIKIQSNCSTWNNCLFKELLHNYFTIGKKLFHVEQFKKLVLFIFIMIALFLVIKPDINVLFFKSLSERQYYLDISYKIISSNSLLGLGMGQFVVNIPLYINGAIESWQFQPVHNVFLLIWSELGIFGLLFFLWIIWKLFQPTQSSNVPRGTIQKEETSAGESVQHNCILCNNYSYLSIKTTLHHFQGILLGLLFIGLFDHYLWDLWPGQALLWIVIGIIVGIKTGLASSNQPTL